MYIPTYTIAGLFALTVPGASVDLNSHADCPHVVAVRMEPDLAGQDDGVQVVLDRHIRVGVSVKDLVVHATPEADPLAQAGTVVLEKVVLGKLHALAIAEATLRLCGRDLSLIHI